MKKTEKKSGIQLGPQSKQTSKLEEQISCGVTEGEYDCMALNQAGEIPCVSLPNGASNMPKELADTLKFCQHIFLWMDFDDLGQMNSEVFAGKLDSNRTKIVRQMSQDEIWNAWAMGSTNKEVFIGRKWTQLFGELEDENLEGFEILNLQKTQNSMAFKDFPKSTGQYSNFLKSKDSSLAFESQILKEHLNEIKDDFSEESKEEPLRQANEPSESEDSPDKTPNQSFVDQIFCASKRTPCTSTDCLKHLVCFENCSYVTSLDPLEPKHVKAVSDYLENKPIKDANDALILGKHLIKEYLFRARTIGQQNIMTFGDMKEIVRQRLFNMKQFEGVKASQNLGWFNKYVKGFRRGEFSIFTGHTGSGKTTFLTQYALEFVGKGIPTLFCSFEMKNEVIMTSMLKQFAGEALEESPEKFDYWAEKFQNQPMFFQRFFGSTNIDKLVDVVKYTIERLDVAHIILDNLQFLMGTQARGYDKFEMQDEMIAKLRKLATEQNVHISLVIHPRKSVENEDLSIASIFGTAKSTQEADNVFILQNRDKFKIMDIKKNRFDGEIGRIPLIFNKTNKRFVELTLFELENLLNGQSQSDVLKKKLELEPITIKVNRTEELPAGKVLWNYL